MAYHYSIIICVFSHCTFFSASETWYWYGSILPCSIRTLLAKLLCLSSYKQCCTRLLKVSHKCCNMNMLRILLIYPHSPSGALCPQDWAYIYISQILHCRSYNILINHLTAWGFLMANDENVTFMHSIHPHYRA